MNKKKSDKLIIANKELTFQNEEKESRAAELVIANKELVFQNEEKEKRVAELVITNKELVFQNEEKEKRAAELVISNKELAFQNEKKEKRAAELIIANKELVYQKELGKNQQALSESENHLRTILQTNHECIKLISINGELEDMNPAGLAMLEADSLGQIRGKSLFDIIDKPYQKAFNQLTKNVFKGKSGILEFEITGLKGTRRWLETHAIPLKDVEGKITSLLGITRDITDRKKTENEILRVLERYDILAKATSDTIWDWDITNDTILYNEGITNMFGYEKTKIENIVGWWKVKIHPDDLQRVSEVLVAAFKQQSFKVQLEYRFRCADKSFKYINDRAFIIYDEHKKPCKMIGAMQDVSEIIENEISMNELNKILEKQAKELSISNKELEEQNHKLKQIAWTQSHIVRAPLARMLGIVNIIKDMTAGSPDYEKCINHFITSGNELDDIIKDIVNITNNINTR